MDFAKIIEDAQNSQSSQMIELLMYEKTGNLVHVNCFKFFDLCGSETNETQNYEEISSKASLTILRNVARRVSSLAKPLTYGDEIPDGTGFKESALSRVFSSSFNGGAFNILICCIDKADGEESFNTMNFGLEFSKMKSYIKKPKSFLFTETNDKLEEDIKNDQATLLKLKKYSRHDIESQIFKSRMID